MSGLPREFQDRLFQLYKYVKHTHFMFYRFSIYDICGPPLQSHLDAFWYVSAQTAQRTLEFGVEHRSVLTYNKINAYRLVSNYSGLIL